MADSGSTGTNRERMFRWTCSFSQWRQCHSWSTRYWAAGLMSWHSWAFSVFRTPGRAEPKPLALSWHQACTCWRIPHRNVLPAPHQSLFLPVPGRKQWPISGRCEDRSIRESNKEINLLQMLPIVSLHLKFALVKGTHGCLVSRMAQVHKHNIPCFLLRSREILFIDPICQCNCREKCVIVLLTRLLRPTTFKPAGPRQALCPHSPNQPAVVSFMSLRQLRPAIWAASNTDLLSASE